MILYFHNTDLPSKNVFSLKSSRNLYGYKNKLYPIISHALTKYLGAVWVNKTRKGLDEGM